MEYIGKLYGKIGDLTFDTGHTTEEWDRKQCEIDELVDFIKRAMYKYKCDNEEAEILIQKHTKK